MKKFSEKEGISLITQIIRREKSLPTIDWKNKTSVKKFRKACYKQRNKNDAAKMSWEFVACVV